MVLEEALLAERVTQKEVEAAVRDAGYQDLSGVGAVVLETDASFSVIGRGPGPSGLLDGLDASPEASP